MLRPHGYAVIIGPDVIREIDTFTCFHCNRVTHLKPKEPPYATCKRCMNFICASCYAIGGCRPLEQWLEEQERAISRRIENDRRLGEYRLRT